MFEYKVAWCPVCNQGWVEIVQEVRTKKLLLLCSECESEWHNPAEIKRETVQVNFRDNGEPVGKADWAQITDQG